MKCPNCQFENRKEAIFCRSCGTSLESDISCPKCDSLNPSDSKFCEKCGQNLKSFNETPSIDYSEPQSYTPKHLSDKILTSRSSIEGERKLVTVLFADVANYTSISEKLDPEEVHQIIDGCFKVLMDEIHKYEGTINQFTGDGVMALFGAPISHEDHPQRACLTALAIQKEMDGYSEKIKKDCNIEFKLRVGLNSGPVIVGAIGDDLRMDYTAVGDTTNLAMRMESMAEPASIQISENTYRLIKAYFDCEDLGSVPVKGKEEPQRAYKLIKPSEVQTRIEASISKGLVRFVGRKNSMIAIQNAWDKAANGSGQVLGVVGEAGVGKSRLLLEFRSSIADTDFNYFEGRCLHYGGSMAYLPILDIIRAYFGIEEGQREYLINRNIKENLTALDRELLLDFYPAFQDMLSLTIDEESWLNLEPKIKRERTFEALRNLFIRLSEEKPLIIAVEDLHWMDKTSEEFINYFIDSMAHSPILLILLYRSEYTHQWGSKSYYSKIGLDQLTMESSADLVSAILEDGEVASELKDLILSRSAGNPLFMEEFTHTLLENGSIERKNNQFVLNRKIDDIQVPETIQGIIASRMDRLEENLKRTMQVASVIGRDFAFRILQTITGMREELKSYLLNLQGLEFIYEKSLFPDLEYIFKHALTQEVAYNSLLNKRRREIHEKIGEAIELIYADRLPEFYEMLAYHYKKSDNIAKSYQYLKLSGKKSIDKNSHWEAIKHFKEAIEILNKMPQSADTQKEQVKIRRMLSISADYLGYPEELLLLVKEGLSMAEELNDKESIIFICASLTYYHSMKGEIESSLMYGERILKELGDSDDINILAPVTNILCLSYISASRFSKIRDIAPKVLKLIEKEQKECEYFGTYYLPYASMCAFYALSLCITGEFKESELFLKKGMCASSKINDLVGLMFVEIFYGMVLTSKGDGNLAVNYLKKAKEHAEQIQFLDLLGPTLTYLAFAYYLLGDLNSAKDNSEKALTILKDLNNKGFLQIAYRHSSLIYNEIGDYTRAIGDAKEALQVSQNINNKFWEGRSMVDIGRVLLKSKSFKADKAEQLIQQGIDIIINYNARPMEAEGYLQLGELYIQTMQQEKAVKTLKKAESMFRDMGMDYYVIKTQEVLKKF